MKTALRIGILLISVAWAASYSSSAVGQTQIPLRSIARSLKSNPALEIHPGKAPSDKVDVSGVTVQITTTSSKAGDIRFHVVIHGQWGNGGISAKRVEDTLSLIKVERTTPETDMFPIFEPYPGVPKVNRNRKGETITADFTAPRKMIDDPELALYFASNCLEGCTDFYARLSGFKPTDAR